MQTARNKLDNSEVTADEYARLTPADLAYWRGQGVCPGCGASAYYRANTTNGRVNCFCGRHLPGCELAASQSAAANAHERNARLSPQNHPGQRIVVNLAYGTQPNEGRARSVEQGGPQRHSGDGHVQNPHLQPETHRRPSSLLSTLMDFPQFRASEQVLSIRGHEDTTVADFFVRLDQLTNAHINQAHGFWGRIDSACYGSSDELWLNCATAPYASVCIPRILVPGLLARNGIKLSAAGQLQGAFMLAIGVLRISSGANRYIEIRDLENLAIRLP